MPELSEQGQAGALAATPSDAGGTPAANLALLPAAPSPGTAMGSVTGAVESEQPVPAGAEAAAQAAAATAKITGQSSTLLTAMQQYTKAIQDLVTPPTPKMETPIEAAAKSPADKLLLLPPNLTQAQRLDAQADINRQQAAEMLEARLKLPIRTLSGTKLTPVDRLLARAENLMREGQYYRASQAYGTIIATTPDNPLAWLGRANALLAAGDYVSAYQALEQGIQRFPQMMQFNFDLPALVGNREVLDVRRAELERNLASRPNYQFQFLLGYLEYFTGLRDMGMRTLHAAANAAPAGSVVIEAYKMLASHRPAATRPAR